jgi:hypothetical protein
LPAMSTLAVKLIPKPLKVDKIPADCPVSHHAATPPQAAHHVCCQMGTACPICPALQERSAEGRP